MQWKVQVPMLGATEQTQGFIADILLETRRPGETQRIVSSPRWLSVKQNWQWILGISQLIGPEAATKHLASKLKVYRFRITF
jgi:hypothetical protein